MSIVAKYVGNGEFLGGVPARDLEDGDWARLDDARRELVEKSPLYELVKTSKRHGVRMDAPTPDRSESENDGGES